MEYASRGVANAGLATGIVGTSLGVLNSGIFGGGLGSLFSGNGNYGNGCSDNMPVNRYELNLQQENASLKSGIALRDANTYSDQKLLEVYKYFDGQIKEFRDTLCAQAVHNQKTEDSFVLARQDIASVRRELSDQIKLEAERRCCGDNSIVNYVNATFYPKSVADVTVGTTTTAQTLYNPLPDCGCCNN